jgi:hypothetical protein
MKNCQDICLNSFFIQQQHKKEALTRKFQNRAFSRDVIAAMLVSHEQKISH